MTNKLWILEMLDEVSQKQEPGKDTIQEINGLTALSIGYRLERYDDPACISQDTGLPYTLWKLVAPDGFDLSDNEARYSQDHALEDAPDFYHKFEVAHSLPLENRRVWKILSLPWRPEFIVDILESDGSSCSFARTKRLLSTAMLRAWWDRPLPGNEPVFTECPRCNGAMEDGVCTFCGLGEDKQHA